MLQFWWQFLGSYSQLIGGHYPLCIQEAHYLCMGSLLAMEFRSLPLSSFVIRVTQLTDTESIFSGKSINFFKSFQLYLNKSSGEPKNCSCSRHPMLYNSSIACDTLSIIFFLKKNIQSNALIRFQDSVQTPPLFIQPSLMLNQKPATFPPLQSF